MKQGQAVTALTPNNIPTEVIHTLIALTVDEETATEDACRIEHLISKKILASLKKHYLNYKNDK